MGLVAVAVETEAGENETMLAAAGYVLHAEHDLWLHPRLDRGLDAGIAKLLSADQIAAWIAAGLGRA
jgi:hypothetical protein